MGLTHHWRRPARLPRARFRAAVIDCRQLFASATALLAGRDGTGSPILQDDRIIFNGRSPLACDPFEIAVIEHDRHGRSESWAFCKTQHMPYDLYVKAALIVLQHHLHPDFVVVSDQAESGWSVARDLVQAALGYGQSFTLSPQELE